MKGRWLQNLSLRQVGNELGDSPFRFANCPVTNHLDFGVARQHGGQTEFALAFIKETQDGFADFFRNSNFVSYAQRRLGNFGDHGVCAGQPVEVSPVNLIVLELFFSLAAKCGRTHVLGQYFGLLGKKLDDLEILVFVCTTAPNGACEINLQAITSVTTFP